MTPSMKYQLTVLKAWFYQRRRYCGTCSAHWWVWVAWWLSLLSWSLDLWCPTSTNPTSIKRSAFWCIPLQFCGQISPYEFINLPVPFVQMTKLLSPENHLTRRFRLTQDKITKCFVWFLPLFDYPTPNNMKILITKLIALCVNLLTKWTNKL